MLKRIIFLSLVLISLNAFTQQSTNFISHVGFSDDGFSNYTGTTSGWNQNMLVSENFITPDTDGSISFTITNTDDQIEIGLSEASNSLERQSINYRMSLGEELHIWEMSSYLGRFGELAEGDVVEIGREGDEIYFKNNGDRLLSISTDASLTLFVKVQTRSSAVTISDGAIIGDYYEKMELTANTTHVTCFGGAIGAIDLTLDKGVAPYSYLWSNGASTQDLTGLEAGLYSVIVADDVNQQQSFNIIVGYSTIWDLVNPNYAISENKLLENENGNIFYKVNQAAFKKSFGFEVYTINDNSNSLAYGIELKVDGSLAIIDEGVELSGDFGTYEINDKLELERVNGVINYKKNGVVLYTSVGTNKTLVVKYKLDLTGATFDVIYSTFCIPAIIDYTTINESKNHLGGVAITPIEGFQPFTYLWTDGSTLQNREDLKSGFYDLAIIDSLLDTTMVQIPVAEELDWGITSGVSIHNNRLTKTSEVSGFGTSYAVLNNETERGTLQMEVGELGAAWKFGFNTFEEAAQMRQYEFYINENNELITIENSGVEISTTVSTVKEGDVLSIEKTATSFLFKKNGAVLRQVSYTSGEQYQGGVKLSTSGKYYGDTKFVSDHGGGAYQTAPRYIDVNIGHVLCYSNPSPNEGPIFYSTGSLDVTIQGAVGPFTYSWSGPNVMGANITTVNNTFLLNSLVPGTYTITVAGVGTKTVEIGYQTVWKNKVNVESDGNNLSRFWYTLPKQVWNAGASSLNSLSENTDGWASFRLDADYLDYEVIGTPLDGLGVFVFGLSESETGVDPATIEYGIRILASSHASPGSGAPNNPMQYLIVENGVPVLDAFFNPIVGNCEIGDVFKIGREDDGSGITSNIIYYRNGVPIHKTTGLLYKKELIIDASIYEGFDNLTTSGPPNELWLDGLPQIVNAASSFECTADPIVHYKANAWVKLKPAFNDNNNSTEMYRGFSSFQKKIGETSDNVVPAGNKVKFVYELWNADYTYMIESHEWFLLNLEGDWKFYQIEFPVTKQLEETNMLVYIKNDDVYNTQTSYPSLFIDDLIIYPADAKYSYTSNDKFGNATHVTDVNENHTETTYDEWARPVTSIDAENQLTQTFDYKTTSNINFWHNYNEVTTYVEPWKYTKTRQYMDGFGKAKQTITTEPSKNLSVYGVTNEYDNLGRLSKAYKPFVLTGTGMPNRIVAVYPALTENIYGTSSSPFVENNYENWPEAKVTNTTLPKLNSELARTTAVDDNASAQVTLGSKIYNVNELLVKTITNEVGDVVTSYTDKLGRLIATRTPIGDVHTVGPTGAIIDGTSPIVYATTLYEYDYANNLKKVTDPEGKVITYAYNSLGQIIQEVNPDKGISNYKYDKFGRLRFTQDQEDINLIASAAFIDHFTFSKYDDWDRVIEAGMIKNPAGTSVFSDIEFINDKNYPEAASLGREIHLINLFDGAIEDNSLAQLTDEYVYSNHTALVPQATDHKVYTYDYRGLLDTKTFNLDGLTPGHSYIYTYNLLGTPAKVEYINPNAAYNFTQEFTYDDLGRLIAAQSNNGTNPLTEDVKYTYDPLGRLFKKGLSPTGNAADPYEEYIAFNYNIREQQTKEIAKQFKNELDYDLKGNIINQTWNNNKLDNTGVLPPYSLHSYDYYYDDLNRLTGADYAEKQTDNNIYSTIETTLKDEISLVNCFPIVITNSHAAMSAMKNDATDPLVDNDLLSDVADRLLVESNIIAGLITASGKTVEQLTQAEAAAYIQRINTAVAIEEIQLAENKAVLLAEKAKIEEQEITLTFDGVDDYLESSTSFMNEIATGDFTFEARITGDATLIGSNPVILCNRTATNLGMKLFLQDVSNGSLYKMLTLQLGGINYFLVNNGTYNGSLLDEKSHYVSVARNGATLSFYIDGFLIGTKSITDAPDVASDQHLTIGKDAISGLPFTGEISNVRIWNIARSADEIRLGAHRINNTINNNAAGLLASWRINDGFGGEVLDESPNQHNLKLGAVGGKDVSDPQWGPAAITNVLQAINSINYAGASLAQLSNTIAQKCTVNTNAMAYETLINDAPVNPTTITSQKYDAAYWYQLNGNFTEINRANQTGGPTTQNYLYTANNNQLSTVNWIDPGPGASTSTYNYDAIGNLTSDARSDVATIVYNQFHNLPTKMIKGITGDEFNYRYDMSGNRSVKVLNAADTEYYLDGIVVDKNNKPKQYSITDGFATLDAGNALQKNYNITDWLGNVRLVMDATGNIENVRDHFPYGKLMDGRNYSSGNSEGARYQFTGHEFDGETMFGYHGARYYNRELGRYMSMDPMQQNYTAWTPYNYVGGNPIRFIDPDGKDWWDVVAGSVIGVADNLAGSNFRANFTPTDAADYNNALDNADNVSMAAGAVMMPVGAGMIAAGATGLAGSGVAAATVVGAPVGAVGAVGSGTLIGAGAVTTIAGGALLYNAQKRGKNDFGKKKSSGGNGSAKKGKASTKNNQKINQKRKESWGQKEQTYRQDMKKARENGATKKQKASIQKQIDHAVNQQKASESHGNANKR